MIIATSISTKKIEKPLLEKPYFLNVRNRNFIESKKNKIPIGEAIVFNPAVAKIHISHDKNSTSIIFENEEIARSIMSHGSGSFIIPMNNEPEPNDLIMSRFLAKCALELLVSYVKGQQWIDEIINKKELDPLRNYARYGRGKFWIYNQRRIYNEEDRFTDHINHPEPYEILHEMEFSYLESKVMYFVLVIFGIEYVINLGRSELDMYYEWLKENKNVSPVRIPSEVIVKR
ncbi:hypothetical protein [Flavobacterium sp. WG21]|uniref:hypothetical protein n=1 Tax=Flavobacterium sp. WG21 TaxID=1229487 RepID=UPI0003453BCF|nr:hypothetical protein [Flavobacterium sp. WG21]